MTEKPFKSRTERYEEGGHVIEMMSVAPDQHRAYHGGAEPCTRAKWEVHVDGELRGYAFFPKGFKGAWVASSLIPRNAAWYHGTWEKVTRAWDEPDGDLPGTWDSYAGLLGHLMPILPLREGTQYEITEHKWRDREHIARAFAKFVDEGRAPNRQETEAYIEAQAIERQRRKDQDAADKLQRETERAARDAKQKREADEKEERRLETLEGLRSILDRFGVQHSNLEQVALTRAIEAFTR